MTKNLEVKIHITRAVLYLRKVAKGNENLAVKSYKDFSTNPPTNIISIETKGEDKILKMYVSTSGESIIITSMNGTNSESVLVSFDGTMSLDKTLKRCLRKLFALWFNYL